MSGERPSGGRGDEGPDGGNSTGALCTRFTLVNLNGHNFGGTKSNYGSSLLLGLALVNKAIVFRFIIEYNSLRDFGP
jgi:hypothetical protein